MCREPPSTANIVEPSHSLTNVQKHRLKKTGSNKGANAVSGLAARGGGASHGGTGGAVRLRAVLAARARGALLSIVLCAFAALAFSGASFAFDVEFCDVYIGSDKIFSVTNTHLLSAIERAERINERLESIVQDPSINPDDMEIRVGIDGVPVIFLGDSALCSVTAQDAKEADKTQVSLAREWMLRIKKEIEETRKEKGIQAAAGTTGSAAAQGDQQPARSSRRSNSTLSEHAVLLLFIEISLLLLASLICGEIMVRLGQPAIIGQILAGLLLGQTFFGQLFPDLSSQLFPSDGSQSRLIEVISWIGVSFLLLLTGMETDTATLRRQGKSALYLGLLGLFGPLVFGALTAYLLPDRLIADPSHRLAFAVFVGTVFAASSVPVVAKILLDMKMIRMDIGQLIMSTSLSHDLLCCLLLAVIAVLSGSGDQGGNPIVTAVVGTILFLAALYFGRPLFFGALRWVNDHVLTANGLITSMIVLLLVSAATTQALGVHIVLGAFAAGFVLSQTPVVNHKVVRPLEIVTMGFFAPIFFASSGLNVNLSSLLDPELGTITIVLCLASLASKVAACLFAGRLAGLGKWESLSIGVGANAKGSLGLILAILGYSLNIITLDMFAVVIFVSLFSTGAAAPLMKMTMARVPVTEEEKERIKREERQSRTILHSVRRVLWPTTGKGRNRFIGILLNRIGERQVIETTALWVKSDQAPHEKPFKSINEVIDKKHVNLQTRTVRAGSAAEAISEEGNRGYDLLIMSSEDPMANSEYVFSPLVDSVIKETSTRVLVVYEPGQSAGREIKRVLVPVSGSDFSVAAGEFGISLARSLNARVVCLSIAESGAEDLYGEHTRSGQKIESQISEEIEGTLAELASALDVDFEALVVKTGSHPAQATVLMAQHKDIDLIVVGAEPKLGKALFFGHTINFLLRNAPCAVAVLKVRG